MLSAVLLVRRCRLCGRPATPSSVPRRRTTAAAGTAMAAAWPWAFFTSDKDNESEEDAEARRESQRADASSSLLRKGRAFAFDVVPGEGDLDVDAAYAGRDALGRLDRLRVMWRTDEYGMPSPELMLVYNATLFSGFLGLVWGGYVRSRDARQRFMRENRHEMFKHPYQAQAAMVDRMALGFFKGGFKLGWRMALMSFLFASVGTSLNAVRNDVNPLDHAAAGAVMGALWKFKDGPRATTAGAAVGSALGLTAGVAFWVLQLASGETVSERWLDQHRSRQELNRQRQLEAEAERNKAIPRYVDEDEGGPGKDGKIGFADMLPRVAKGSDDNKA